MKKSILMIAAGSALAMMMNGAMAAKDRTGAEVVDAVCAKCHAEGRDGAPKIGNLSDWGTRMGQGIKTIASHAVRGYRGMPAHGGDSAVTDLEITRAIIYMIVPKSGAHASMDQPMVSAEISGKDLYGKRCSSCHATGKEGAPKSDDFQAWGPRIAAKGIDGLTASAVNGHNKMPSRGGLVSVNDAELKSAIEYMITMASSKFAKKQTEASH
jgi:cytochrome c5